MITSKNALSSLAVMGVVKTSEPANERQFFPRGIGTDPQLDAAARRSLSRCMVSGETP